jgi:hypothetical protein
VKPELPGERDHGLTDGVMLLASLCIAVMTWSSLARISAVPMWRLYCGVGPIFVFALAGLTRHARWANAIRLILGVWTIIAPFLLGPMDFAPTFWIYLTTGVVLTAVSIPGVLEAQAPVLRGRKWRPRTVSLPF